jgi:hypothetical protein
MLIEYIEVEFLQIVKELLRFNCHQEGSMCLLRQLVTVFTSNLKVLLGICRDPRDTYKELTCLLKNDVEEFLGDDALTSRVPDLVEVQVVL